MTTSKLPEWPDEDSWSYDYQTSIAALARMEALANYVKHDYGCAYGAGFVDVCDCGLSELLSACDRGAATQSSGAGRKEAGE